MPKGKLQKKLEENPIAFELEAMDDQVKEIQAALESVSLTSITNVDDKLQAIKLKLECLNKLGPVLAQLKELKKPIPKNVEATLEEDVSGNAELSPLEQGILD